METGGKLFECECQELQHVSQHLEQGENLCFPIFFSMMAKSSTEYFVSVKRLSNHSEQTFCFSQCVYRL